MPSTYKTPGVYVEEISTFPPSVAQVETAVPAFIGYTEIAEANGTSLVNIPTRITSLLEYQLFFGGPYTYGSGDIKVVTNKTGSNSDYSVKTVGFLNKTFKMYDSIRMYFDNGGGHCYIVSVNTYEATSLSTGGQLTSAVELSSGLAEIEKFDEPTILVFPDAVLLQKEPDFYALQQAAITQAAKLQDRVAVLDLKENVSPLDASDTHPPLGTAVAHFRSNIGINNLKYAMAYAPWLYNSYDYEIPFSLFNSSVFQNDGTTSIALNNIGDSNLNGLVNNLNTTIDDNVKVSNAIKSLITSPFTTIKDQYGSLKNTVQSAPNDGAAATAFLALMQYVHTIALVFPAWRKTGATQLLGTQLVNDLDSFGNDSVSGLRKFVTDLVAFEKNDDIAVLTGGVQDYTSYNGVPVASPNSWLGQDVSAIAKTTTDYGGGADKATALAALNDAEIIFNGLYALLTKVQADAEKREEVAQATLYSSHPAIANMVTAIQKQFSLTPPSGAVCGVYALVDDQRGVWKAPANVSIASVIGPSVMITNDMQDDLNVDVEAGKSINAIRAFTGKGTLIWGARTLAGNDNEWRYVPVRRFFNMVEESVKKASAQFVFEPNDANTWIKVKAMIENYLTILWRQGALAGAKPEHAFFVKVGLGETMTAIDILEGRMNIEIGMAAVRPAEFIILKFSHKMQES